MRHLRTLVTFQTALMTLGTAATISGPPPRANSQAGEGMAEVTEVQGRWGPARLVWAAPGWATGAADKGVARMALDSAGALGSRSQTPHSSGAPAPQLRGKAWGCSWGCCPPEGHAKQVQQPKGLPI